ncbi:hypothetical protein E2562_012185 [Oryza meyeriana var. granulata]|uniref:Uncharacterized protein n=1 Tax=Oryza meyeriana var. granulata TaxID=110450 RepID=A0A6G1F7T2_9ORYZ|nr:hypothetical protein E2562_012185 [Oryza meyeriana var. granulata]
MRSWGVRFMLLRFILLLTLTLLGAELTGICHGRIIPSLEVITVQEEGELPSPPSKGYGHPGLLTKEKAPPGDAPRRRHCSSWRMTQEEEDGVSASRRVVPEGPNPLHN